MNSVLTSSSYSLHVSTIIRLYITTLIIFFQSFTDHGLNGNKYSCIDRCQFKINNDSHCLNRAIDFVCGNCTDKFCLDHLIEHEHTTQGEQDHFDSRSNVVSLDSTSNVTRSTGVAKSSWTTCTSSCSSCNCSSACSCTTFSCSFKSNLILGLLQDFSEFEI